MRPRLPEPDSRSGRVGRDHEHPAVVDDGGTELDMAATRPDRCGRRAGVRHLEVDDPAVVGHRHEPGDEVAPEAERRRAVERVGGVGRPTEQTAVEGERALRIAGCQLEPDGFAHESIGGAHRFSLRDPRLE